MGSTSTRIFLMLAILFSGLLAGSNIDRAIAAMPAWQQVGATAWAEFSRHADLGNGIVLYPLEALGAMLLTLIAAISFHFDKNAARVARMPIYAAVVLAACGLGLTAKAAPIMLGIRSVSDPAQLQRAFEGFWYWGNLRALCQISTFLALLSAVAMLWRNVKQPDR